MWVGEFGEGEGVLEVLGWGWRPINPVTGMSCPYVHTYAMFSNLMIE